MVSDSRGDSSGRSLDAKPETAGPIKPDVTGRERLIQWFRVWRKPLRRWVVGKSHVPSAEADDLTQEVFVRLLRYSDDVLVQNPQAYLFRIAANVASEWRERCRVRLEHDDSGLEELPIDPADEPGNELAQASSQRYLWTVVDRLPARQKDLLQLHVIEGLTYKQIAAARGLTYRIVLRDLSRAYSTLRMTLMPGEL